MDTPRRHSLAVAVRRSERTITKILAAVCTTALLVLYAIIEMSDLLQVPYLGTAVLVVGLVSLLLTVLVGVPLLIIKAVRAAAFGSAVRGVRPRLEQWAAARSHRVVPEAELKDAPPYLYSVMTSLKRHDEELGMALKDHDLDGGRRRYSDAMIGSYGGHTTVIMSAHRLPSPVLKARLIALQADQYLPALSVTDRANDELWISPKQQFESGQFNQRWRVVAKDPRYASAVVHNQVLEIFTGAPLDVHRIDFADSWVVSWAEPGVTPEQVEAQLALLLRVAEEVPRFVLQDYR